MKTFVKSKTFKITLAILLLAFLCVGSVSAAGGSGTSVDPYIIETPVELQSIANNLTAYYKLGNDIDLTGVTWTSIDNFAGTLDGDGHTVKNLTHSQGLFNTITSGSVTNITLDGFTITATGDYVGALAGKITGGGTRDYITVSHLKLTTAFSYAGGVVGQKVTEGNTYNYWTVTNSYITGTDSTKTSIGGIVGLTNVGTYNYMIVKETVVDSVGSKVGGIHGNSNVIYSTESGGHYIVFKNSKLIDSYVKGVDYVGGFCGYPMTHDPIKNSCYYGNDIRNCEINGCVIESTSPSTTHVGGFLGAQTRGNRVTGNVTGFAILTIIDSKFTNSSIIGDSTVYNLYGDLPNIYIYKDSHNLNISNVVFERSNIYGATIITNQGTYDADTCTQIDNVYLAGSTIDYTPTDEDVSTKTFKSNMIGAAILLDNNGLPYKTQTWDYDDGTTPVLTSDRETTHTYSAIGDYTVMTTSSSFLASSIVCQTAQFHVEPDILPHFTTPTATPDTLGEGSTTTLETVVSMQEGTLDTFKWQYSTDNGTTWNDIQNSTQTYVWTPDESVYKVRAWASNEFGYDVSEVIDVSVYGKYTINTATAVPENVELGNNITLNATVTPPSNEAPNTVKQWEVSTNGGSTYSACLTADVLSGIYVPQNAGQYKFRLSVGESTYGYVYSNVIDVNSQSPEVVTITSDKTNVGVNTAVNLTATIQHQYQDTHIWKESTDGTNFTDISGATNLTYQYTPSTSGVKYFKFVSTNVFNTYESNIIQINTYGQPTVAVSVNPQSAESGVTQLTLTGVVTPDAVLADTYTQKWQVSTNGTTYTDIGTNLIETYTPQTTGTYYFKMIVSDTYYNVESSVLQVVSNSKPVISNDNVTPLNLGYGTNVTLSSTVTSSLPEYTIQWLYSNNNGTTWNNIQGATTNNYTWTNAPVGVNLVKVSATNVIGTTYGTTFTVNVYGQPSVVASVNPTGAEAGVTNLELTATVTPNPVLSDNYSLQWKYSENGTTWTNLGTTAVEHHTPSNVGTYYYKVVVTDSYFEVESNTLSVPVNSKPVINSVSANPVNIGLGNTTTLTCNVSSDLSYTLQWKYFNGTEYVNIDGATSATYVWTPEIVGVNNVKLYATNPIGTVSSNPVTVNVYGQPTVTVSVTPDVVAVNEPITFNHTVTVNSTLGDSNYTETLKYSLDNSHWTTFNGTYTPTTTGVVYFKDVVTDNYFTVESSVVTATAYNIPVVTVSVTPTNVATNSDVNLIASVTSTLPLTNEKWQVSTNQSVWTDVSVNEHATYKPTTAGTYYFRFTAVSDVGTGYSEVKTVNAFDARTISVTATPSLIELTDSVNLKAVVTTPSVVAPIVTQKWQYSTDNGITWTDTNLTALDVNYTPVTSDTYKFRYIIIDNLNVQSTSNVASIDVAVKPIMNPVVPGEASIYEEIEFVGNIQSVIPLTDITWYVDDTIYNYQEVGHSSTITYSFTDYGTYHVYVTATNALGTTTSDVYEVVIDDYPFINNFTLQDSYVTYGNNQVIRLNANVNPNALTTYIYYGGSSHKVNTVWTHEGQAFTGTFRAVTDKKHFGELQIWVTATNSMGTVVSETKTFEISEVPILPYEKTVIDTDNKAMGGIIVCALAMLIVGAILIFGIIQGNMPTTMVVALIALIGMLFLVLVFMIIFSGSLSGIASGLVPHFEQ